MPARLNQPSRRRRNARRRDIASGAPNLSPGVAVPLSGPKIFNVEAIAQLNWRF